MRGAAAYAAGSGLRHSGDGGGGREMKWAHCSRQAAACLRPQPVRWPSDMVSVYALSCLLVSVLSEQVLVPVVQFGTGDLAAISWLNTLAFTLERRDTPLIFWYLCDTQFTHIHLITARIPRRITSLCLSVFCWQKTDPSNFCKLVLRECACSRS